MPCGLTVDNQLDPQKAFYEICFVDLSDFEKIVCSANNIFATVDVCHLAQVFDSSQLLDQIQRLGKGLGHVHFSDVGSIWCPFISLVKEGVTLGDGRIGKRVCKELLHYFLEYSKKQDLAIVFELHDENFKELEESRESLIRTMEWLETLKQ
jgi:sugar phosphate isomerase/epimerase